MKKISIKNFSIKKLLMMEIPIERSADVRRKIKIAAAAVAVVMTAAVIIPVTAFSAKFAMGDVDGDGSVDSCDALLVMRASVGLVELTNEQIKRADSNKDGVVDTMDAISVLQVAAGLIPADKSDTAKDNTDDASSDKGSGEVQDLTEEEKDALMIAAYERRVGELCDKTRLENGLSSVEYDEELAQMSEIRTGDMLISGVAHFRPNGKKFSTLAIERGYIYMSIRENTAEGYATPEEVFEAWMNSDGHRHNILAENMNRVGVSCRIIKKDNGSREIYWVLMLAHVPDSIDSEECVKAEILSKINAERNNRGLEPLTYDYEVAAIAKTRVVESTVKFDGRKSPDGSDWDKVVYDAMPDFYGFCGNGITRGKSKETADVVYDSFVNDANNNPQFFSTEYDFTTIGIAHVYKEGDEYAHYWAFVVLTDNM